MALNPVKGELYVANADSDTVSVIDTATNVVVRTIDLTPYVGQTVQIVWDYAGVDMGTGLQGWLVDDVAVTGTLAGSGSFATVIISKNISQGNFTQQSRHPPGLQSANFRPRERFRL